MEGLMANYDIFPYRTRHSLLSINMNMHWRLDTLKLLYIYRSSVNFQDYCIHLF